MDLRFSRAQIIGAAVVAAVVLLYYFLIHRPRANQALAAFGDDMPMGRPDAPTGPRRSTPAPKVFPLQRGSRGDEVRRWQQYLMAKGFKTPGLGILLNPGRYDDGVFGKQTEADTLSLAGAKQVSVAAFDTAMRYMAQRDTQLQTAGSPSNLMPWLKP